jgi:hypothetical protein
MLTQNDKSTWILVEWGANDLSIEVYLIKLSICIHFKTKWLAW